MNCPGKFPWTDEAVSHLKKLQASRCSASGIADSLSHKFGIVCSRNAVIGKLKRIGLSPQSEPGRGGHGKVLGHTRAPPSRPERTDVTPFKGPPKLPDLPLPVAEMVIPSDSRCGLFDLTESKCKWPIGTVGDPDFHFCGAPSVEGLPYCDPHCGIAYQPAADRRRERRLMRA